MVSPLICNKADQFLQILSKSPTVAGGAFVGEKVIVCSPMPHFNGLRNKIVQIPREGLCITCYLLPKHGKTCDMIKASRFEDTIEPL